MARKGRLNLPNQVETRLDPELMRPHGKPDGATIRQSGQSRTRSNKTGLLSYLSYDRKPPTAQDGNAKIPEEMRKIILPDPPQRQDCFARLHGASCRRGAVADRLALMRKKG
jgi:hypothetical protein